MYDVIFFVVNVKRIYTELNIKYWSVQILKKKLLDSYAYIYCIY